MNKNKYSRKKNKNKYSRKKNTVGRKKNKKLSTKRKTQKALKVIKNNKRQRGGVRFPTNELRHKFNKLTYDMIKKNKISKKCALKKLDNDILATFCEWVKDENKFTENDTFRDKAMEAFDSIIQKTTTKD